MDEHDPLIERLHGLGRQPVEPSIAARHLAEMAGAPLRTHRLVKLKVGTAFFAGLILGGTGLAYASALPSPVQDAAHGALSQVGLSVPNGHGHGPARYNGPECTGGPYANHGQYVRSHRSDPNAGQSRCGKPVQAGNGGATDGTEAPETPDNNQGGTPGVGPGGHGNHGKKATTPSTAPKAPPTRPPSTTVPPAKPSTTTTSSTTVPASSTTSSTAPQTTSPQTSSPQTSSTV